MISLQREKAKEPIRVTFSGTIKSPLKLRPKMISKSDDFLYSKNPSFIVKYLLF